MSLIDKILKNSNIKDTAIITNSKVFGKKEEIPTEVPMLNIALGAGIDTGLQPGILTIAGKSRMFKTLFSLMLASHFQKKFADGVVMLYDSEFGSSLKYFDSVDMDTSRLVHTPITNIEELNFDIMKQLEGIERGDKIFILIDSIGNLASKREVDNALNNNSAQDMTRAKTLKSLWRMVTPHLNLKDIYLVNINHVYDEMCMSGDTRIVTEQGIKRLQDVMVEDKVRVDGEYYSVTHTYTPEDLSTEGKEFLEVEFDDGSKVRCTDNHRFLYEDGRWIEASLLQPGHVLF